MIKIELFTDDQHRRNHLVVSADLAQYLRSSRLRLGKSQEQVAFDAGIAVATYSTMERGYTVSGASANPTLDTLLRVQHALSLPPNLPRLAT